MNRQITLGVRAHDFPEKNIEALAAHIEEKGYSCIQLALAKALPDIHSGLGSITPGLAKYIKETLSQHNLSIAVLGCYINPIHPHEGVRRQSLERFKEHIRFARDFGCSIVGTETGSMNEDFSYHPDTHSEVGFNLLLKSVAELVEEAEKFGVFVGIEGVTSHTVSTPKKMKRVLDTIASNNLQVIFDPVNLLSIENYKKQDDIIKESFELFGDKIIIIHAKDFIIEDGKMKTVETGKGMLNYELLFKFLKERKPYIEILFEDSKAENADEIRQFVYNMYDKC